MTEVALESVRTAAVRVPFEVPSLESLLALHAEPLLAASRARARRDALRGRNVRIAKAERCELPMHARIEREGMPPLEITGWPEPTQLRAGDRLLVQ
ncbi:MAG: hypothetical protein IAG13_10315, partial [Deltaproteobacteria bacterium]|nr:hypothetical protein [Nannocystaceae bacterium]